MANEGNFAPQGSKIPQGAQEIMVRVPQGPMLGKHFPVAQPGNGHAPSGAPPTAAPPAPPQQAQIAPAQTPRGAQQVPLAGQHPMMGASAPAPAPAPAPHVRPTMEFTGWRLEGVGPDGRPHFYEVDVGFPVGTKVLGWRRLEEGQ